MITYFILNSIVVAAVLIGLRLRLPQPMRTMRWPLLVLLLLTCIFDNLMIWCGLFSYNPARISGIRLGLAPIEDFMYPVLAFLLMPSLWQRLHARSPKPNHQEKSDA